MVVGYMKQESLDKALDGILKTVSDLDIDIVDKCELMLNLKTLLENVSSYEKDIEILRERKK